MKWKTKALLEKKVPYINKQTTFSNNLTKQTINKGKQKHNMYEKENKKQQQNIN